MNTCAKAFEALGDPTRRSIFEKLREGPMAVVDIADGLSVSRPAVSQHLKVLREAKLININAYGNRNVYQINREGIIEMRNYLDGFWEDALLSFKEVAEHIEHVKKTKKQK